MLYGFDIGGTKIEIAVFDLQLNLLWRKRITTPQDSYTSFLNSIIALVKEADHKFSITGQVGIGIAGMINQKSRTVYTTNIEVVKNHPFIIDLEEAINRPVQVNNDANCFILSEAYSESFSDYTNVLGIILGTGLGGGLIINHKVISGANGCGGEIGHIRLPVDALTVLGKDMPLIACGCGLSGCCERYLSGTGFEWLYHYFYHRPLKATTIIEHYYQGDILAQQHVERYLELLAMYLGNLMMIIDAELIIFGGGLSNFHLIYQEIPNRLPKYILPRMNIPRIEKAKFGDSGGSRGAALLCLTKNN